jgi:N-acetylmannosamine-6-phosphate 2-epimerase/N-acetylmannosamine kinase
MEPLRGRLIVSCQAPVGDPFSAPASLALFAQAAVRGGAVAIRTEGPDAVQAIKAACSVPVIGLRKILMPDGRIMITPTNEDARNLAAAGADSIALDCTSRGRKHGALERLRWIRSNLGVPVWADIATAEEAVAAAEAGADAVLSTLRGYTENTATISRFEASFIADLVGRVTVPVIAEGRIATVDDAVAALAAGAYAVVVGTAITRPEEITRNFATRMMAGRSPPAPCVIGIDLGGTQIKSGVASGGVLRCSAVTPTPAQAGRAGLLRALADIARARLEDARNLGFEPAALGVATAGWVDPRSGRVLYATENLPEWSGTELKRDLEEALGLPVAVENDANALAIAESELGAARTVANFVCLTLGTGVGGGCYVDGKLLRGAHFLANGVGHMIVEREGRACSCGRRGCLEAYANAQALLGFANHAWSSPQDLIAAANQGDAKARQAVETHAGWIGIGCVSLRALLDPELIVLAGGLALENPLLVRLVEESLRSPDRAWQFRPTRVVASTLGYSGGVLGATIVARKALADLGR